VETNKNPKSITYFVTTYNIPQSMTETEIETGTETRPRFYKAVSFSTKESVIDTVEPPPTEGVASDDAPSEGEDYVEPDAEKHAQESNLPLYASNPEQWLYDVTKAHEYVCIVIFRGHWCSYDHAYLTEFGQLNKEQMKDHDVCLIAWTSEGPEGAKLADEHWKLTTEYGFDQVIGDNTCALPKWLKEDELLPNLIFSTPDEAQVRHKVTPNSYGGDGICQPGVAFYAHHGILVMHWEAKVTMPTHGGAHRPMPSEMWKKVEGRKHALDHGNAAMPINGDSLKLTCEKLDGYCNIM
jgi:hypothetical protein